MEAVSQAEFAKQRGVSRQRINQLVADGTLDAALTADGKIDPAVASQILEPTAKESDAEWRRWRALREKLKYETEAGEVMCLDDVRHAVADLGVVICEQINHMGTFAMEIRNAESDKEAKKAMDKAVRETRRAIAEKLRAFDPGSSEEDESFQ